MMSTQKAAVGQEGISGDDDAFLTLESDDCSSSNDGTGQMTDRIIL